MRRHSRLLARFSQTVACLTLGPGRTGARCAGIVNLLGKVFSFPQNYFLDLASVCIEQARPRLTFPILKGRVALPNHFRFRKSILTPSYFVLRALS